MPLSGGARGRSAAAARCATRASASPTRRRPEAEVLRGVDLDIAAGRGGGAGRPVGRGEDHAGRAPLPALRPGGGRGAGSTAGTCASSTRPGCARRWAWSPRSRCSSPPRWRRTSATGGRRRATRRWWRPAGAPTPTTSSPPSPTATPPGWASAASSSRAASASASPSPAPSSATPASSSSTRPPARSTPSPRRWCEEALARSCAGGPRWSSPTASPRWSTADRVVVVDGGLVVEAGPHAELLRKAGLYRRLVERQMVGWQLAPGPGSGAFTGSTVPGEPLVALVLPVAAGAVGQEGQGGEVLHHLVAELHRGVEPQRRAVLAGAAARRSCRTPGWSGGAGRSPGPRTSSSPPRTSGTRRSGPSDRRRPAGPSPRAGRRPRPRPPTSPPRSGGGRAGACAGRRCRSAGREDGGPRHEAANGEGPARRRGGVDVADLVGREHGRAASGRVAGSSGARREGSKRRRWNRSLPASMKPRKPVCGRPLSQARPPAAGARRWRGRG